MDKDEAGSPLTTEERLPTDAGRALVVTDEYTDLHIGRMLSAFLVSAGYDVALVEGYHEVLTDIRAGHYPLVVCAGTAHFLGRPPTEIEHSDDGGSPWTEYVYEALDREVIDDMRPNVHVPIPRILFRMSRPSSGQIVWHCLHLPGVALFTGPIGKAEFLSIVADLMQ